MQGIATYVPSMRTQGFAPVPETTWDMVGALHSIRKQLHRRIVAPIRSPEVYAKIGKGRPQSVLLWGPPGCGKTLLAKAVANAAGASFILVNGPELLNKYVGESERSIRELFARARSCAPCLIFFDEIDAMAPRRENTSTEASARIVNMLLAELDGVVERKGVYVIATTNHPETIDPAMLRPGRFDAKLFVDLPTPDERTEILRTIYKTRLEASTDMPPPFETIAKDPRCDNFSGADLGALFDNAVEKAIERAEDAAEGGAVTEAPISLEDWEFALATTRPSVEEPEKYRRLEQRGLRG